MQSSTATTANRQIARAAGIVMITFVFSKGVSLFSTILLGRAFGTSAQLDAFYAANRFSDMLFNLVAGGALASAFVPTFTALLTRGERDTAWRLASSIANLVLLALTSLGILGMAFAPLLVREVLAPGFTDPAQQALTVNLLRIQTLSAVIFGISGLMMGVLNAHQSFLFPALAPALYPLGIIAGVAVLSPSIGIYGAAWGVVLGSAMHLLVQLPGLLRLPQLRYSAGLGRGLPVVRQVLMLMGPRLLGVAVVQLNFLVNTAIASGQPEGSQTAIGLGFGLMMMPQAAIAQSIAIASLPTFSAQVARGRLEEMRASLAATLRAVLLLSLPATVGLILLGRPLIAALYQGGTFTERSTEMVAWALLWYAVGLVGHCIVEIVSRAFYALHDTRTPVSVGIGAMSLNVLLSFIFSRMFEQAGWMPHGGLALANSLATALECIVLLVLMRRRLAGIDGAGILRAGAAGFAGSLVMGAVLWAAGRAGIGMAAWAQVGGGLVIGAAVYGAALLLLGAREARAGLRWAAAKARLVR